MSVYLFIAPNCRLTAIRFNINGITFILCSGFQQNPEGRYLVNLKGPVLYLVGPYTISGRVLVLPIQGVGKSNITLGEF